MSSKISLAALLMLLPMSSVADEPAKEMDGLPLVFSDDFEDGHANWEVTDEKAWELMKEDGNSSFGLNRRVSVTGADEGCCLFAQFCECPGNDGGVKGRKLDKDRARRLKAEGRFEEANG